MTANQPDAEERKSKRKHVAEWLRNRLLAGVVVAAPIGITIWLIVSFVNFVDDSVKPLIPRAWNPETYLKFALPGMGIVVALAALLLLGTLTANLVGRSMLRLGERILNRVPFVRSIYFSLKQVFETFGSSETGGSFKSVVLVEFPSEGIWAVAFMTNKQPGGEINSNVPNAVAVFVPGTPNPAMGNLCYVPADKVIPLAMTVEEAAKLVVSAGIVSAPEIKAAPGK